MSTSTADDVITRLRSVGLLNEAQADQVRSQFSAQPLDAQQVVQQLVDQNLLTPWQAQAFLDGVEQFYVGDYLVLEQLGAGDVSSVFRAQHVRNGVMVALKLLAEELMEDDEAVGRFEREIQLAAKLNHPNIVAVYDAEMSPDGYFLAMEYVGGETSRWWLDQHRALPVEWVCEVGRQAALGLQYAHQQELVHRDINPDNLLVVAGDIQQPPLVKILDFGLARAMSENWSGRRLTRQGDLLGLPDYISPEQANDPRNAGIASDTFSLGCTLFVLLTGEVPFGGTNPVEKLLNRVRYDAPPLSSKRPEVAAALDDLLARMLARNPTDRPQTPQEVADAMLPLAGKYAVV